VHLIQNWSGSNQPVDFTICCQTSQSNCNHSIFQRTLRCYCRGERLHRKIGQLCSLTSGLMVRVYTERGGKGVARAYLGIADAPRNLMGVVRRQSIEILTQYIEQRLSICLRRRRRKEGREKVGVEKNRCYIKSLIVNVASAKRAQLSTRHHSQLFLNLTPRLINVTKLTYTSVGPE